MISRQVCHSLGAVCSSPKFCRAVKSTASNNFLKPNSAITAPHVPRHLSLLRSHPSPPAPSTKSAARKPRPQTTSPGVEKKEPPTHADKMRSVFWIAVSRFCSEWKNSLSRLDFFTVPTITFQVLFGFFVIAYDRRRILHFNVTSHPSSLWIMQQLREAFRLRPWRGT